MAITFEQFFRAIAEQESNNNYYVRGVWVGGDRAYGKYQVMGFNIPSWSKKYYGRTLTPEQYLNNPDAQEAVARGRLQEYWDKYGARGAASAWYSGNASLHNSTRPQPGGPSIKGYVDSVLAKAAKYPSGGSGGGGGGGSIPTAEVKPLARNEAAEQYGFVEGMLNSIPELKKLFDKAVKESWTPSKFQAELRNTNWFKSTSETERQFIIKQYGDPATVGQMWHMNQIKVWQLAAKMGATLDWDKVNNFAYGVMAKGWTDEKLRSEISKYFELGAEPKGEGSEVVNEIREYGYQMGVDVAWWWVRDAARAVTGAGAKVEDYKSHLRNLAKGIYSNWSAQIEAGQTVMELASPYLQSMSTILELPPGSIGLQDPTIKDALQAKDPQTGANRIKQIWEFENDLRGDERWKKTQNAQNSTMQVAHQVLSDFGFKY